MKEIQVSRGEAGQRLDKLLGRYLNTAPSSFIYKMLRKKNITLNDRKATGKEILEIDDCVKIFLSDDTWEKFSTVKFGNKVNESKLSAYQNIPPLKKDQIIYEDEHILILNKPTGMLSQKAQPKDISMNEQMISYLCHTGQITAEELQTFKPAVCNRLDRNTSGLLMAGKSLAGLQVLADMLKTRSMHKYYTTLVAGQITQPCRIEGYLQKDENTNKVTIFKEEVPDAKRIITEYRPIKQLKNATVLEVLLVTGRSHQIRAHLASIGHPIVGDAKYGNKSVNCYYEEAYRVKNQMLHAQRVVFPELSGTFSYLSGKEFKAPFPKDFQRVMKGEA